MNWTKAALAGVVGGLAMSIANFVMHGVILGNTYTKYAIFSQEQANPAFFFLIAIVVGLATAVLFGKTRTMWADGFQGGAVFGFWVGLVFFFDNFYYALVLKDFPYYLAWCWGGVDLISFVVLGAAMGAIYKRND